MNIYELEKLATPGAIQKYGNKLRIIGHGVLAIVLDDPPNHDTHLLAHCRNNFMRALEMLKQGVADFENSDTNAAVTWADRAKALITELEEVK